MITLTTERTLIKTAPKETADYFIDQDNMAQVGLILQGMYSDPDLAVIREYTANAVDAHAQVGKHEVPVIVRLPTSFSPQFEVEDEGPGLSVADTRRLLLGYGASGEHKRTSNDYVGGFGIGCKCALAIVDQFTYTIWHGGMKRIWSSYKDDQGLSKADLVFEAPSDRGTHTGVKVTVPVPDTAFVRFQSRVQDALRYFKVTPTVEGLQNGKVINKFEPLEGVRIASCHDADIVFSKNADSDDSAMLVMGGIGYPINFDKVFDGTMPTDRRVLVNKMVIRAPVGTVPLAPSREALLYTQQTRTRLQKITEPLGPDQLEETLRQILTSTTSKVSQTVVWSSLMAGSHSRLLSSVYDKVEKKYTWLSRRGLFVSTNKLASLAPVRSTRCGYVISRESVYSKYDATGAPAPGYRDCVSVDPLGRALPMGGGWDTDVFIEPSQVRFLFLSDKDPIPSTTELGYTAWKKEGLEAGTTAKIHVFLVRKNAKSALVKEYPWIEEVLELHPETDVTVDKWIQVPPEGTIFTKQQWLSLDRATGTKTSGTKARRAKVAAHSVKLVKLTSCETYVDKSSDRWVPATISSATLAGKIYLAIDRFEASRKTVFDVEPSWPELADFTKTHPALKGQEIYGLRIRDVASNTYGMRAYDEFLTDWALKAWGTLTKDQQSVVLLLAHQVDQHALHSFISFTACEMTGALLDNAPLDKNTKKSIVDRMTEQTNTNYSRGFSLDDVVDAVELALELWFSEGVTDKTQRDLWYQYVKASKAMYDTKARETEKDPMVIKVWAIARILQTYAAPDNGPRNSAALTRLTDGVGLTEWRKTKDEVRFGWYLNMVKKLCSELPNAVDYVLLHQNNLPGLRSAAARRLLALAIPKPKDNKA